MFEKKILYIVVTIQTNLSVLTRLNRLETESQQQKHTIKFLESKVERHEDVIKKLEKKLKHKPTETNDNLQISSNQVESSTSIISREKRPFRLLQPNFPSGYVIYPLYL